MTKSAASRTKTSFDDAAVLPDALSARVAAPLLAAVGDVTLILSSDGVILDATVSDEELATQGFATWAGERWIDTVTVESRPKIEEMIAQAGDTPGRPRWRQVNHPTADGDVPVRYLVMPLDDDDAPAGRRLVAVGRDLRGAALMQQRLLQTQQSLERDYLNLRQAEARYRLLFDLATDPVLIVDAKTRRIREANPAVHRLLDAADGALIGQPLGALVALDQRDDLVAHLGAVEAADEVAPITLRLAERRGEARISARLVRNGRAPSLIVRIEPRSDAPASVTADPVLDKVIERMPDAFVLVDGELVVLAANAAFVELTGSPTLDRVIGAPLGRWLGRPGIDLELIAAQLREHGSIRNVATILRGAAGVQEEIEISGVEAPRGGDRCYGFTIRNVGRRLRSAPVAGGGDVPRSVSQLTELVGRMSLKDIVRESTDMIERLCIEAALAYTADNRASAAEILGVSRQSLYSKLHRHGLGNLVSEE